jgi:hypothetical protein
MKLYFSITQVETDLYGIDYNPENLSLHQESVEIPETMDINNYQIYQIQDILQKDSNDFGVDIYKEIIELCTSGLS